MGKFVDSIIAYRILKLLVTPFEDTEAYKLGIIDNKGKELIKMRNLNSVIERDSYTLLHRLVFRIKRIIEKIPIENKKILSFAAALSLIKEELANNHEPIDLEIKFINRMNENLDYELDEVYSLLNEKKMFTFKQFNEDTPAANNSAVTLIGSSTEGPEKLNTRIVVSKKNQFKLLRRNNNVAKN